MSESSIISIMDETRSGSNSAGQFPRRAQGMDTLKGSWGTRAKAVIYDNVWLFELYI